MRTISSHQQNRTAQNQRLTKTLLFVSAAAVLAWLFKYVIVEYLLNVHKIFPAWQVYYTTIFLQYSNSFANPIIYAFKIPEFRQSLIMWCLRASFCKYRESGDSFKIFNFFMFCPNKAFSELFSKIQLKDPKALKFFQNRGKFENRHFGLPPPLKID